MAVQDRRHGGLRDRQSPTYSSGLALRFARITRLRDDKGPAQATALAELAALYERQFATKGRAV
ncbi:MAG: hypothetical protein AAB387_03510 [candidate division NC10 bacterium]